MHSKKLAAILSALTISPLLGTTHSFYVGADLSGCFLAGERSDSAKDESPGVEPAIFSNNKKINKKNIYLGVLSGYLFRIQNFGIGPEFFYNVGKNEHTLDGLFTDTVAPTSTNFKITYKVANQFGIHARLGYFFDDYFLYGLAGVLCQTSSFEMKAADINGAYNPTHHLYKPSRKRTSVFSFGLGAQKTITENYALGIEYRFSQFPRRNFTYCLNDLENTTLTSSFKYKLHSIGLKLMYVF